MQYYFAYHFIPLLMLLYFNASVSDTALFEFVLFIVALFNVALRYWSTVLCCSINVALFTVAQLNVLFY